MSALAVGLIDPAFTAGSGTGEGSFIDSIRDDCGYVIRGIDWVCRQIGFDLIALIFDPISGDFDGVDAMSRSWQNLGTGLAQIGANYSAIATATPVVWEGGAADRATEKIIGFSDGLDTMQEASTLIASALQDMLAATRAVCETVAQLLSMVDDLVLTLLGSALKLAKELATGGATIRKIVGLVRNAIRLIETLSEVIPPLLKAFALMGAMFKTLDIIFKVGAGATHYAGGQHADDVAEHGF